MLKTLGRSLLSLLFPPHCELCRHLLPPQNQDGICQMCVGQVRMISGPHCRSCGRTAFSENERCGACGQEDFHFDRAYAAVLYENDMKKALHRFKFSKKRFLTPFFTGVLAAFCRRHLPEKNWDVVPVPLDRAARMKRGFNQTELIGARLAAALELSYKADALECSAPRSPQAFLGKNERKRNVRGRFVVKKPEAVVSRDVLLVDDVLTTGATASACAKALKDAGARSVTVLAFARGA